MQYKFISASYYSQRQPVDPILFISYEGKHGVSNSIFGNKTKRQHFLRIKYILCYFQQLCTS